MAPGYEGVRDAFGRMLHGAGGRAFAAVVGNRPVVDLWGGLADERDGRPWAADTAAVLFSGTKGVMAIALGLLVDRGRLDLDAAVSDLWPEFAAEGKGEITVARLGAHCAGLPGLERPLTLADLHRPQDGGGAGRTGADGGAGAPQLPRADLGMAGRRAAATRRRPHAGRVHRRRAGRAAGLDIRLGLAPGDPLTRRRAHMRQAAGYQLSAYARDDPDPRLALVYRLADLGDDPWNDPRLLAAGCPARAAWALLRRWRRSTAAWSGPIR